MRPNYFFRAAYVVLLVLSIPLLSIAKSIGQLAPDRCVAGYSIENFSFAKEATEQTELFTIYRSSRPENDSVENIRLKRKAKWAKWLGIGSLIGILIPGINLLSLPAAVAAVIVGSQVKRKDEQNKDAATGRNAGWFTIGILLVIAAIVAIVVIFPVGPN